MLEKLGDTEDIWREREREMLAEEFIILKKMWPIGGDYMQCISILLFLSQLELNLI